MLNKPVCLSKNMFGCLLVLAFVVGIFLDFHIISPNTTPTVADKITAIENNVKAEGGTDPNVLKKARLEIAYISLADRVAIISYGHRKFSDGKKAGESIGQQSCPKSERRLNSTVAMNTHQ